MEDLNPVTRIITRGRRCGATTTEYTLNLGYFCGSRKSVNALTAKSKAVSELFITEVLLIKVWFSTLKRYSTDSLFI